MKRRKKPEPGPPVSADVVVIEVPADPDEVLERFKSLAVADARRTAPFRHEHVKQQHKKERDYQEIQAIAKKLRESDPELRAKLSRLATRIQETLGNRGRTVSTKTISRALQQTEK